MLSFRSCMVAAAAMVSLAAQASSVSLAADGQWNTFTVDSFSSTTGGNEWITADDSLDPAFGTAQIFNFTIAAGEVGTLTVVDGAFAGDTFQVFNLGQLLGNTSVVPVGYYDDANLANVGFDFDAALQNTTFSRGVFVLGAGTYAIGGQLVQSVLLDNVSNEALNATVGAIKLTVSPVPEPSGAALALAALGLTVMVSRRRAAR